ncbi:hypothetical protein KBTX_00479 [wastewater metagenome]|uniref:Uncharacterized protein n=3 Tax=root TaxID=1 RepID=A0A5B8R6B5_9ZZZZ|nr:hypothetical protein KBTEX_00479 [uncultured organism]
MSLIHRALKEVEGETARGPLPPAGSTAGPRRWPRRLAGLATVAVLGAVSPLLAMRLLAPAPEPPRPAAAEAVVIPSPPETGVNEGATGAASSAADVRDPAPSPVTAAPERPGDAPEAITVADTREPAEHGRTDPDADRGEVQETDRHGAPADTAGTAANADSGPPPADDGARDEGTDRASHDGDDTPSGVAAAANDTPATGGQKHGTEPVSPDTGDTGRTASPPSPAAGARETRTPDGTTANRASSTLTGGALEHARELYARMMRQIAAGDWTAAGDTLDEVATLLPAGHVLRLRMEGWFAFRHEDYDRARDRYRQILERFPGDEEAGINLAYIHLREGDRERAREVLKSARRHSPDSDALERAVRRLGM